MKQVVVTGATSMIGVALIKALLLVHVEKIYAVVRIGCKNLNRLPQDPVIHVVECNIDNYKQLPILINESCNVFYHLAWQATGGTEVRNRQIFQQSQNIGYTLEALWAAKELKCQKFIGAGSQAEFGVLDLEKISPDSPANPIQPYGIAKYAAGKLARAQAKIWNIDCFWVRIFSVYGRYDHATTMVSSTISTLLKGAKPSFTPAQQRWDYLYDADAGWAFYRIGEMASGNKVYCLGSGQARPLQSYIEEIRDVINPQLSLGIGDIPYPQKAVMNLCADIKELEKDTGWKPETSFRDGILEYCGLDKV